MLYAFQLRAHPNARYQDSFLSLSQKELACMLAACHVPADVYARELGGTPFLCFEAEGLTPAQRAFLAGHSGLYMAAELTGGLLRPLALAEAPVLPQDMPEILKYKGKTNASFTRLLINLALAAGGQWSTPHPLVLDPICGHGTALYCALTRGMNAIGVDSDKKALQEGITFTQKWLQYHRIKHTLRRESHTLPAGGSAPGTHFTLQAAGEALTLSFLQADTRAAGSLLRRRPVQALVADLPYGVQHAPRENGRMSTLEGLLRECLPAWRDALSPGCGAAIAFNTYTLRRSTLAALTAEAGFTVPDDPFYDDFTHWVEQAVNRDVLVALRPTK